jgi:Asp-tRNA(Asn)/Glu-tRNA(Gln) amidotransferase A subunit family amidase
VGCNATALSLLVSPARGQPRRNAIAVGAARRIRMGEGFDPPAGGLRARLEWRGAFDDTRAMRELWELTASEGARLIRGRAISPEDLLKACLARIDATEARICAWVHLDREAALRAARERAHEAAEGRLVGALHGVPVALKDIFDASGLVTTAGAAAFAHRRAAADATSVARLRGQGAVILGKVSTTAFAFLDPSPTRNPWNPEHTPGGSSSGPAAAVAARMVPLALGSQTVGSVLRPAAYCGVVGFKPTHGRISVAGIVPLSASTDHVGTFSRSVEDAALALGLMAGSDPLDPQSGIWPIEDYTRALADPAPPRLGLLRELLGRATPEVAAHVNAVAQAVAKAGASVSDVKLPPSFEGLHEAGNTVVRAEAAAWHRPLYERHAAEYPDKVKDAIEQGRRFSAMDYLAAQMARRRFRTDIEPIAARYDALLSPVAPGPAPKGLSSTGDPYFCAPWSFAGLPAIALPSGLADDRLPLGVQLTGGVWAEARLLGAAAWCERVLGWAEVPPI